MSEAFGLRNQNNEFARVMESYRYFKIQEGKKFHVSFSDEGVDKDLFRNLYFRTHSDLTNVPHLAFLATASLEYRFQFIEDPTTVSGGTDVDIFNRNRNSLITSTVSSNAPTTNKVSKNVTYTGGTNLLTSFVSGFEDKVTPATLDENREWILKPNTGYIFEIETKEDNTNLDIILEWFEN